MASGDTLLSWTMEGARVDVSGTAGVFDLRNFHPVVDLSTGDEVVFGAVLPRNYASGGITVIISYAMATATTNNVAFTTAFEDVGTAQDLDSDGFATGITGADQTVPGTSGVCNQYSNAHNNGAQIDTTSPGDYFRLKVTRAVPVGTDASGDAQIVAVELKET